MCKYKYIVTPTGSERWPKKCPSGYSQHLWLVNDGCEINYCAATHALTPWALPEIRRPPYQDIPRIINNGTQLLITANEDILVKHRESGAWRATGYTTGKVNLVNHWLISLNVLISFYTYDTKVLKL